MIKESCSDEDSFNNLLNGSKNIYFDTKNARHNKFKEFWHRIITDTSKNQKLPTYITFKHNLEMSAYLTQNMRKRLQKSMTQFRTSSYK